MLNRFAQLCVPFLEHHAGWTSARLLSTAKQQTNNERNTLMHIEKQFQSIPDMKRDRESFLAAVAMFKDKKGRNHVEFINTALKFIKEYGVHKDLETYKTLLNIFPKGKMIPQNNFQKLFLHFPMQQNCCVKVLDEMEWNGVQPDKEIHDIVVNAFGEWNFATKKIKRMMYWMPKLKYSNKYLDRRDIEGKSLTPEELAGLALKTMCRDPATSFSLAKFHDPSAENGEGWIASGQSIQQQRIISSLSPGTEIFVDGPFPVNLMEYKVYYVQMTANPSFSHSNDFMKEADDDFANWFSEWKSKKTQKKRSIHEQRGETILALGVLYKNTNEVASGWVERLEKQNPNLSNLLLRLRLD